MRRRWRYPFAAGVLAALPLAALLIAMGRSATGRAPLALWCAGPLFLAAALMALGAWWSRSATWLHLRVEEPAGRRIALSLPAPINLLARLLRLARRLAPPPARAELAEADGLLRDLRALPPDVPLRIEVGSPGGENEGPAGRLEIYVG